ncbi:Nucleotide-binding_alpha-beta plait domain superfamily [Hexamita inflata]|uniref:Nucleotide-binding alpha-beta plait domain superfamily n=1 Tax=Hexamita inflata TaxID=28002 RepID=A0AA86UZB9_9EUKA|nr:Nucleotide-binding alpha-beta plait domain superfamily [Hexamita inflata]
MADRYASANVSMSSSRLRSSFQQDESSDDIEFTSIFVQKLKSFVKHETIYNFFTRYGEIVNIMKIPEGFVVTFNEGSCAENALLCAQKDERKEVVHLASGKLVLSYYTGPQITEANVDLWSVE